MLSENIINFWIVLSANLQGLKGIFQQQKC